MPLVLKIVSIKRLLSPNAIGIKNHWYQVPLASTITGTKRLLASSAIGIKNHWYQVPFVLQIVGINSFSPTIKGVVEYL